MKKIPLTRGKFALVDDEDFKSLSCFNWYFDKKEARRNIGHGRNRTGVGMSRVIMGLGKYDPREVDHKDLNTLNNCRSNLRICTIRENSRNKGKYKSHALKKCSSKYKGVTWNAWHKKWAVQICKNYENKHIGYFENEQEAARIYDKKAKELFGEFARVNYPE